MIETLESSTSVRPNIAPGTHPVESTRYIIATPPINTLCKHIVHWVRLRIPGGIVYAPPRQGKTSALEVAECELITKFPKMPVINLPAWDYNIPSERTFLEDILTASGHALPRTGDSSAKRNRLIEWLCQLAEDSGQGRVVLMIDEAQNLHEKHYQWLMGIHNLLKRRHLNLIVLLVGQIELLAVRAGYIHTQKRQIVGRFMVHTVEFCGLKTLQDIQSCLRYYDCDACFPVDSGWSFTRYFLTGWYDKGGRLERLAYNFLKAFRQVQSTEKGEFDRQIPMQYFCRTAEYFLRNGSACDLNNEAAVDQILLQAISDSGYLDVLLVTWNKPK
jgi:hypothetical protein